MKSTMDLLRKALTTYKAVQIARELGLSSGTVTTWKVRNHISPYNAARLAEMLGEDPVEAAAIAGAEAEPDEDKRDYLLNLMTSGYNQRRADVAQSVEQLIRNHFCNNSRLLPQRRKLPGIHS